MLMKAFQYRLYPTKEQQRLLERQLEACRWLWNTLPAERKQAWAGRQETVDSYDVLAVEDLSVRNMMVNHRLAKSIGDAAWTQFAAMLRYKAEWAGRAWIAVDPRHTSQTCSWRGWLNSALTLADRVFYCLNPARPDCRRDRDRNAALNILARGKALMALGRQCLPSG